MVIQEYLRSNGIGKLKEEYGINSVRHNQYQNLVLFKYNQIDSPKSAPIVIECRGIILDENNDWSVTCRPYDRFFNYGEGCASDINWKTARVYEKADGSLIKMYWYESSWQISTSGTPDASGKIGNESSKSFAHLFWEAFKNLKYDMPPESLKDFTFMFELMTTENRIIVPHDCQKLVLHGIRSNSFPYLEKDPLEINELFPNSKWCVIKSFDLSSIDAVIESSVLLNPMQSEGYVVVDDNFYRVKVKSPQYVALAHMKDSFSDRRMIELVRTNEGSEFINYFPEYKELYNKIKFAYDDFLSELESQYEKIKQIESQKEFAIQATQSKCSGAMFSIRAKKVVSIKEYVKDMSITTLEKILLKGQITQLARVQPLHG